MLHIIICFELTEQSHRGAVRACTSLSSWFSGAAVEPGSGSATTPGGMLPSGAFRPDAAASDPGDDPGTATQGAAPAPSTALHAAPGPKPAPRLPLHVLSTAPVVAPPLGWPRSGGASSAPLGAAACAAAGSEPGRAGSSCTGAAAVSPRAAAAATSSAPVRAASVPAATSSAAALAACAAGSPALSAGAVPGREVGARVSCSAAAGAALAKPGVAALAPAALASAAPAGPRCAADSASDGPCVPAQRHRMPAYPGNHFKSM